ncbi:MAG: thermonuclease family protein [Verrucomicrobiota bacterium]|nr:thermonuclease family protein [Verrucomicrobiota bacterium]
MLVATLLVIGLALLAAYFVVNQKNEKREREGVVKKVLNKDAFFIEFEDRRSNVVRLHGVKMATEREMLDDQIFEFLYSEVRGKRVRVKSHSVETGDILIAEIYLMADEYLNAILVRQGFGRWCPGEAASDRRISDAQETAQLHQQGVWNPTVQQLAAGSGSEDSEHEEGTENQESSIGPETNQEPCESSTAATANQPEEQEPAEAAGSRETGQESNFKPGLA